MAKMKPSPLGTTIHENAGRTKFSRFFRHRHRHPEKTFDGGLEVVVPPKNTFISPAYESTDLEFTENQLLLHEERSFHWRSWHLIVTCFLFIVSGIITGLCGSAIQIFITYFGHLKFEYFKKLISEDENRPVIITAWIGTALLPALLGSLVVCVEPTCAGGGIHWIVGYINGIRIPRAIKARSYIIKTFSTSMMLMSGLAGGKEGPLIHIGAAAGGSLPMFHIGKFHPFRNYQKDSIRRDLIAGGIAAGIAAAFGTPVGGTMLAFEEGLMAWSPFLLFCLFMSALMSSFTYTLCMSLYSDEPGNLNKNDLLFLSGLRPSSLKYSIAELPMFIFLGVLGGLTGTSWNLLQTRLILFRKKYVKTKVSKLLEVLLTSVVIAIIGIMAIYLIDDCTNETNNAEHETILKLHCNKPGTYDSTGTFYLQLGAELLKSMLKMEDGEIAIRPLAVFTGVYYFASVFTMGLFISAGIFIPNLLFGGVYGRLLGQVLKLCLPNHTSWVSPAKYSYICAVTHLSGVLHISFSLAVIWTEACGITDFAIPIFISLFVSKWIATLFTEGMYEKQCHLMGIPLIPNKGPDLQLQAKDIMSKGPLEVVRSNTTVRAIVDLIKNSKHNGFPVFNSDGSKPVGIITKSDLAKILRNHFFPGEDGNNLPTQKKLGVFRKFDKSVISLTDAEVQGLKMDAAVNLEPYMNTNPHFVRMETSLYKAHLLFASLSLRHLLVVNNNYEVVGMITRKDLSVFRAEEEGCKVVVKKVQIR